MEKFDKLINEPYFEKEDIKNIFLNENLPPTDVNLYTNEVVSNSLISISSNQLKSNVRFLSKNQIKSSLSKDEAAELISGLASVLADGYLYTLYSEYWGLRADAVDRQQFLHLSIHPVFRNDFDQKTLSQKIELIGIDLSPYLLTKNVKFLVDALPRRRASRGN